MNPEDFVIKGGVKRINDRDWQFVYRKNKVVAVWVDGHFYTKNEVAEIDKVIKDREHADKFEKKHKIRG